MPNKQQELLWMKKRLSKSEAERKTFQVELQKQGKILQKSLQQVMAQSNSDNKKMENPLVTEEEDLENWKMVMNISCGSQLITSIFNMRVAFHLHMIPLRIQSEELLASLILGVIRLGKWGDLK